MRGGHGRKSTNDREAKPKQNSDPVFGTALELVSVFIEASKIPYFIILLK
jgi:hypothetical protein